MFVICAWMPTEAHCYFQHALHFACTAYSFLCLRSSSLFLLNPCSQTSLCAVIGTICEADSVAPVTTEVAKNPGPRIVYPSVSALPRIYRSVANPPSSSFPHQPRATTGKQAQRVHNSTWAGICITVTIIITCIHCCTSAAAGNSDKRHCPFWAEEAFHNAFCMFAYALSGAKGCRCRLLCL